MQENKTTKQIVKDFETVAKTLGCTMEEAAQCFNNKKPLSKDEMVSVFHEFRNNIKSMNCNSFGMIKIHTYNNIDNEERQKLVEAMSIYSNVNIVTEYDKHEDFSVFG